MSQQPDEGPESIESSMDRARGAQERIEAMRRERMSQQPEPRTLTIEDIWKAYEVGAKDGRNISFGAEVKPTDDQISRATDAYCKLVWLEKTGSPTGADGSTLEGKLGASPPPSGLTEREALADIIFSERFAHQIERIPEPFTRGLARQIADVVLANGWQRGASPGTTPTRVTPEPPEDALFHLSEMVDQVIWMSAARDFAEGGQAHHGWLTLRPRLHDAQAFLSGLPRRPAPPKPSPIPDPEAGELALRTWLRFHEGGHGASESMRLRREAALLTRKALSDIPRRPAPPEPSEEAIKAAFNAHIDYLRGRNSVDVRDHTRHIVTAAYAVDFPALSGTPPHPEQEKRQTELWWCPECNELVETSWSPLDADAFDLMCPQRHVIATRHTRWENGPLVWTPPHQQPGGGA